MTKKKETVSNKDLNTEAQQLLARLATSTISYSKEEYQKTARSVAERSTSAESSRANANKKGR